MRNPRRIGWLFVWLLLAAVLLWSPWRPREVSAPGARESVATSGVEEAPSSPTEAEPEGVPSDDDRVPEPAAAAPASWTLEGRVVTRVAVPDAVEERERAVAGAEVSVSVLGPDRLGDPVPTAPPSLDSPVVAGGDGRFEIPGVPPRAKMGLTFRAPELAERHVTVSTAAVRSDAGAEGTRLDLGPIVLVEACDLEIHVVDPEGSPVDSARVLVTYHAPESRADILDFSCVEDDACEATRTDEGRYVLEGAGRGQNWIEVLAPGYAPEAHETTAPRPEPVNVELTRGALYAGVVLDTEGASIESARAWCGSYNWDDPAAPRAVTDTDGRFSIWGHAGLAGGDWLSVRAQGFAPLDIHVEIPRQDLELRLFREARVAGRVVRKEDGAPLEGVSIRLDESPFYSVSYDLSEETGSDGTFVVSGVPPGSYVIQVGPDRFLPVESGPLEIREGEFSAGHLFELEPGLSRLVRVVDADSGEGIPGAHVIAYCPRGDADVFQRDAEADASGRAELTGLLEGLYQLWVYDPAYVPESWTEVPFVAGQTEALELSVHRGAAISGRIVDADGEPVSCVDVTLIPVPFDPSTDPRNDAPWFISIAWRGPLRTTADPAGRYRFQGLRGDATYRVVATDKSCAPAVSRNLPVTQGDELSGVDLQLSLGGAVEGFVGFPSHRPDSGACVTAYERREAYMDGTSRDPLDFTDDEGERSCAVRPDGTFRLEGLRPGAHQLKASSPGYVASPEVEVTVTEGETVRGVGLVFPAGEVLSGRVVDTVSAQPLEGVEVSVESEGTVRTGPDGTFRLGSLDAGVVQVLAYKDGYAGGHFCVEIPSPAVVLRLAPLGCVRGRVHGKRGPVREAELSLPVSSYSRIPWDDSPPLDWTTDPQGRFDRLVRPGRSVLTVEASGFGALRRVIDVRPGETIDLDLELRAAGSIAGVVIDRETGAPVADASVRVIEDGPRGGWTGSEETQADGTFLLEDVGPGVVDLVVASDDAFGVAEAVEVRAGETVRADVVLERTSVLWGWVVRRGEPVGGVRIVARSLGGGDARSTASDLRGRWALRDVAEEEHEIEVYSGSGEGTRIASLRDHPLNEVPTVIDLAGVTLRGRILRGGKPAPGSLTVSGPQNDWASTDEGGTFVLRLPGPGTYGVAAEVSLNAAETDEIAGRAEVLVEVPPGVSEVVRDIEIRAP